MFKVEFKIREQDEWATLATFTNKDEAQNHQFRVQSLHPSVYFRCVEIVEKPKLHINRKETA